MERETKLKIGVVCYPTVGGSGVVATELGHLFADKGHELHFIAYDAPFRLRKDCGRIFFHRVLVNRYEMLKYADYALPLAVTIANVVERHRLDLLHVHYAVPHAVSGYLAKQMLGCKGMLPLITTLHGTDITLVGLDPSYDKIVKHSIENSDSLTAVSNNLREETRKILHVEKAIRVIYNFFTPKPELIGNRGLRNSYVKPGEKLLVHSSNFRSVKQPEDLIRIFLRVCKQIPAKLLLVGAGEGIELIKQMIYYHDIADRVFFAGEQKETDAYIAAADLFLLPSMQESFGLAALEAMAYGVPVIASSVGGIPEVVLHGQCGFLAPPCEVEEMANRAVAILSDQRLHEQMSRACVRRVAEFFSADLIYQQYLECYRRALAASCG